MTEKDTNCIEEYYLCPTCNHKYRYNPKVYQECYQVLDCGDEE